MKHKVMRRLSLVCVLLCVLLAAWLLTLPNAIVGAKNEPEFGDVVKLIESHFRVKHKGVPVLAKLPLKVAGRFSRIAEIGSVKLAVFDDKDFSTPAGEPDLAAKLRGKLEPHWQPLLELRAGGGSDQTHIYTAEAGRLIKIIVIQISRRDAVAAQVSVTPENLAKLLRNPETMGETLTDEAGGDEPE